MKSKKEGMTDESGDKARHKTPLDALQLRVWDSVWEWGVGMPAEKRGREAPEQRRGTRCRRTWPRKGNGHSLARLSCNGKEYRRHSDQDSLTLSGPLDLETTPVLRSSPSEENLAHSRDIECSADVFLQHLPELNGA